MLRMICHTKEHKKLHMSPSTVCLCAVAHKKLLPIVAHCIVRAVIIHLAMFLFHILSHALPAERPCQLLPTTTLLRRRHPNTRHHVNRWSLRHQGKHRRTRVRRWVASISPHTPLLHNDCLLKAYACYCVHDDLRACEH